MTEIRLPHNTTYNFGIGVDRLTGSAMNMVVEGQPQGVPYGAGSIQSFEVARVRTSSDLQNQLGIDIDASYGCASFGAGVEARFNFLKDRKVQTSCLFMAITATIRLEDLSIPHPTLTRPAADLIDRPDIFGQRYGDMFLRACKRGGLFVGVLRIETNSEEEASSLEGELQGTYGLFSAEARTHWTQVIHHSRVSVYCSIYSEGGPAIQVNDPNDPEKLLELANDWMKAMNERPNQYARIYEWTLSPITIAEGPLPPNLNDLEHAQDVLKFCARKRASLLDQLNLLDWILSHPERFDWSNLPKPEEIIKAEIREAYIATQHDLQTIADCASAASNHPKGAKFPADYAPGFPKAIVPSSLPKPKPTPLAPPTIRVPNMVGFSIDDLEIMSRCLGIGTLEGCLAGTVLTDNNDNPWPIPISREFAEFIVHGGVEIKCEPDLYYMYGRAYVSNAQDPPPGTLVSVGTKATLYFRCTDPDNC